MDYGKYKQARNASWQCIIDYKINSLPVKISDIIKQSDNITLHKNSKVDMLPDRKSGMVIYENGIFHIVYNDLDTVARCRFTITHEFGHIVLGDVIVNATQYRTFDDSNESQESSANVFARDFLAPACILHEIGALNAVQIKQICNISYCAASIRAKRMHELERRNKWYLESLECKVRDQFQAYINKYK